MPAADIDVIVPTRDRPEQLAACVRSLAEQTFARFRVIVVDDGSHAPATDSVTSELADRHSPLILRNQAPAGPAASRNRGVAAGDAPYLVFLDDDVRTHPALLARHYDVLCGSDVPVVSIGALHAPPDKRLPPWDLWQADRLARHHRRIARGEASPAWTDLYTGNVAMRRADFTVVGGFDEAFARQEDMELGFRLSQLCCRFVFEPGAIAWHDVEHSLSDWLRLPAASARCDVLMDRLRPGAERLRSVRGDRSSQHWMLRAARRAFRNPSASQRAGRLAITAGRALHRVRADRLALPAFSLVWDLEYGRALEQATATVEAKPPAGAL